MTGAGGVLAVILGRAGSRGLPGKNAKLLCGRPMICHTIDDALESTAVDAVIVSTDGDEIAGAAQAMGIEVIRRPAELATDDATVAAAAQHAVRARGTREGTIVILYANVPLRPRGLIDGAVELLVSSGADSVQSYQRIGKHHPDWMVTLDAHGRIEPLNPQAPDRRQMLPARWLPDGAVIAVTRRALLEAQGRPHAFLGSDRRGIESAPGSVIDVDTPADLIIAEALMCAGERRDGEDTAAVQRSQRMGSVQKNLNGVEP